MLNIAICEDEKIFLDEITHILTRCMEDIGAEYTLDKFGSGEELVDWIEWEKCAYDLIFLDIRMGEMNGMELARLIRKADEEVFIVFTTSLPEYSLQGYEVRALHYLLKPVEEEQILEIIKYALEHKQKAYSQSITIKCERNKWRKIPVMEIIYVETEGRRQAIHLADDVIYYRERMSTLEADLPCNIFVRCHQSFLVNIKQVKEITRTDAVLKNNSIIPVSRNKLASVQQLFLETMSTS